MIHNQPIIYNCNKPQTKQKKIFTISTNYAQLFFYIIIVFLIYIVWLGQDCITKLTQQQLNNHWVRFAANTMFVFGFVCLVGIIINYYNTICVNNKHQELKHLSNILFLINHIPFMTLQNNNKKIRHMLRHTTNILTELHQISQNTIGDHPLFRAIIIVIKLISISIIINVLDIIYQGIQIIESNSTKQQQIEAPQSISKQAKGLLSNIIINFFNVYNCCFAIAILCIYLSMFIIMRYVCLTSIENHELDAVLIDHITLPEDYDANNLDYSKLYNSKQNIPFRKTKYISLVCFFNVLVLITVCVWLYQYKDSYISLTKFIAFIICNAKHKVTQFTILICIFLVVVFKILSICDLMNNIKDSINYIIILSKLYQKLNFYYDILNNLPFVRTDNLSNALTKNIKTITLKNVKIYINKTEVLNIDELTLNSKNIYSIQGNKYKTVLSNLLMGQIPHKDSITNLDQCYYTGLFQVTNTENITQNINTINQVDINNFGIRSSKGNNIRYNNYQDNLLGYNNNQNIHLDYFMSLLHLDNKLLNKNMSHLSGGETDRMNLLFMMNYLMSHHCASSVFVLDNIGSSFNMKIFNKVLEQFKQIVLYKSIFVFVIDNNKSITNLIPNQIVINANKTVKLIDNSNNKT